MYLLDTNVVSELRKVSSGKADAGVLRWVESVEPSACYLSVITVMELEAGVLSMERRDARQGEMLRRWLDDRVMTAFEHRVLSVDRNVALRSAALHVPDRRPDADALIAATAFVHGLSVVTRNAADFASTGSSIIDPWKVS